MDIEALKKKKALMEDNLKALSQKITQDTQNALRLEGAILGINEIIVQSSEEKKIIIKK